MALIETKNRFDIKNAKADSKLTENQFFGWSGQNFYRSSYNDMSQKVSYCFR